MSYIAGEAALEKLQLFPRMGVGNKEWHAKADLKFDLKGNILLFFKTANFSHYQKTAFNAPFHLSSCID